MSNIMSIHHFIFLGLAAVARADLASYVLPLVSFECKEQT